MDEPIQRWVIPIDDSESRPPLLVPKDKVPKGAHTLVEGYDLLPRAMPDGWGVLPKELAVINKEKE